MNLLNLTEKEVWQLATEEYKNTNLTYIENGCVFLNSIFFDEKIYGMPSIASEKIFEQKEEENIDETIKEKILGKKRPGLKEFVSHFEEEENEFEEPRDYTEDDFD